MTTYEIILTLFALLLLAIIAWQSRRMEVWIAGRNRVFQIALAYIAAHRAGDQAALFANAVLYGHHAVIDQRFPDYVEFYGQAAESLEQDYAEN